MHWLTVTGFRCRRKCHSCLLLTCFVALLTLGATAQVSARPQDEQLPPLPDEQLSALNDEYEYDVDNVEFHQAKLVDGVLHEDHPVIMYKEDFVSEDYDPKKARNHHARKHKNLLGHRRRRIEQVDTDAGSADAAFASASASAAAAGPYHALKPEKIYFDILSTAPLVSSDETKDVAAGGKLDTSKVHVEVISLADDIDVNNAAAPENDAESKQTLLNKRPKKFHRRQRRDTTDALAASAAIDTHAVQKRNAYLRYTKVSTNANSIDTPTRTFPFGYLPPVIASRFVSHPVAGEYYNGPVNTLKVALQDRFGGPNNNDRVIWPDYTPTKNPNVRLNRTRGTPAPLFPQRTTTESTPPVTRRPAPTTNRPTEQPAPAKSGPVYNTVNGEGAQDRFESSDQTVTSCVWAIAGCCSSRDSTVRYSCFERYGCNLVFWNLNPCAEKTRDSIVDYLNNQFD